MEGREGGMGEGVRGGQHNAQDLLALQENPIVNPDAKKVSKTRNSDRKNRNLLITNCSPKIAQCQNKSMQFVPNSTITKLFNFIKIEFEKRINLQFFLSNAQYQT